MKNFKFTFYTFFAVLFMGCDSNDDGFYNEKYVNVPNLVNVDIQPSYFVGDYFYVKSDFSRIVQEPVQATDLDIYQSTNGAEGFVFSYTVEKLSGTDVWSAVQLDSNALTVIKGSAQAGFFVLATAVYNQEDESYEYEAGYHLTSPGQYRISFGVNSDSRNEIELRSDSRGNNLFLNIISPTTQLNSEGYYTFTVN